MVLLLLAFAAIALVFYLMGIGSEHDRPGGTKDLRRKLYLERERSRDLRQQRDRAEELVDIARNALVFDAPPLTDISAAPPISRTGLRLVGDGRVRIHG